MYYPLISHSFTLTHSLDLIIWSLQVMNLLSVFTKKNNMTACRFLICNYLSVYFILCFIGVLIPFWELFFFIFKGFKFSIKFFTPNVREVQVSKFQQQQKNSIINVLCMIFWIWINQDGKIKYRNQVKGSEALSHTKIINRQEHHFVIGNKKNWQDQELRLPNTLKCYPENGKRFLIAIYIYK